MELSQYLKHHEKIETPSVPRVFDFGDYGDRDEAIRLFEEHKILRVVDDYEEQVRELFQAYHPEKIFDNDFEKLFKEHLESLSKESPFWQQGRWVYYPWRGVLSHVLSHDEYYTVRTSRNRNLITESEQSNFYDACVGIAGLSVGASIALAVVLQGGARKIKLADHDELALSNTNRIATGAHELGSSKADIVSRIIYEINPYAEVHLYPEGLSEDTIANFFKDPKVDIMIDEVDNLAIKYRIRQYAEKHKIPIVMAADNGDNGIVDIERYDRDPQPKFFQGRLGGAGYEELRDLNKLEIGRMITKLVGPENVPKRMQDSLLEIGKTIVSWPQLGGTALLNGAAVSYCVRKIANNEVLEGNRAIVSLDEKLDPEFLLEENKKKRAEYTKVFREKFDLI